MECQWGVDMDTGDPMEEFAFLFPLQSFNS